MNRGMSKLDFNCFAGGWPFHRVRTDSLEKLARLHAQNGIDGGYVSSTDAIFYNDPYEADARLASEIKTMPRYRHVITVNPTLPGCMSGIRRALRDWDVAGVRILPGFHDYFLNSAPVKALCELLREYRLPLFLTLRMEDERVTYLLHPKNVPAWDIAQFISTQEGFPILVCNARANEIGVIKPLYEHRKDVFCDCSGLKDSLYCIEEAYQRGILERCVYGSLAPVFCLASSLITVEKSKIPEALKKQILTGADFCKALAHSCGRAELPVVV